MGNISGNMKSLCENITKTREDRKNGMEDLRQRAEAIRDNARKFVDHCRKVHNEMGKGLKEGLSEDRKQLIRSVTSLREDFRAKERDIRADLSEANRLWSAMNKTLGSSSKSRKASPSGAASKKRGKIK